MIYLYGIIDSIEMFCFIEPTSGREIFNLASNGMGMAVSRASDREAEMLPDNILAHNAVMEQLLARFTVLPVKFGTLLSSESEVRELLCHYGDQFSRQLYRLRGKVEMGVKVLWNIKQVQSEFPVSEMSGDLMIQKLDTASPGHKFLLRKYREIAPEMQIRRKATQIAARIHEPLASISEEARRYILRTPALMLSGAYLLYRQNAGVFREEYLRLKRSFPEYKFLMSGPWPPYNFVRMVCLPGGEDSENGF